nr:MAG TPA: hypothetical protein [Caudoviricetes sp.]
MTFKIILNGFTKLHLKYSDSIYQERLGETDLITIIHKNRKKFGAVRQEINSHQNKESIWTK